MRPYRYDYSSPYCYRTYANITQSPSETYVSTSTYSGIAPICGQVAPTGGQARSGMNFIVPIDTVYTISGDIPSGVTFQIKQDKGLQSDPVIGTYTNGAAADSKSPYPVPLNSRNKYYIAIVVPNTATKTLTITFAPPPPVSIP